MSQNNLRINNNEKIDVSDVLLNKEELENHSIEIAKKHKVSKEYGSSKSLLSRLNNNFDIIANVYKELNKDAKNNKDLSAASEWLLDNFYKIEEQVKVVKQELAKDKFLELKILDNGFLKGYPRVYVLVLELVSHSDGRIDENLIIDFVKAYQSQSILSIAEIWSLSLVIRCALIEKIRNICEKINENQIQWKRVEKITKNQEEILNYIKEEFNDMDKISSSFIEHLLKKLRRENSESGEVKDYIEKKLLEFETTIDQIIKLEHKEQAARKISIGNAIISLNIVATLDWNDIFESLSAVEEILRKDPAEIYEKMDFDTRDYYRSQIEKIAKKCKVSEVRIAKKAIEYAQSSETEDEKSKHVGYYIVGKGRKKLLNEFGYSSTRYDLNDYPVSIYLSPIIILNGLIVLLFLLYSYRVSNNVWLSLLAGVVVLIPSSDIVVTIVNWIVTHNVNPAFLPKIEYRDGIPKEVATMVVIPTLVPNEKCVEELLKKLEVYYHGNKEKNIYFAIAGDFKDSEKQTMPEDKNIIKTALDGVKVLNEKYSKNKDIFFYFHRDRQYCKKQQKWMGWERKRGALVEFNKLLTGSKNTSYSVISGDISNIVNVIKYVITIDADTNLTMDTARKLIGTISHPLNKGILDKNEKIVVDGYGLIQPRIAVDVESANSSIFTRIFAGQGGIDTYTTAISDVYQDLFGEGIFTGKGIYDLQIFNKVLNDAIPDNTILSHDLLEGSYIRVGLATNIELIDGYPSKYSSFIMRLHRWVRGDWQLIRWLFPNVKNREGKIVKNPLSTLSKWKILDNMRRSKVSISLMILLILGLIILPGETWVWIGFTVFAMAFPLIMEFVNCIICKYYKNITSKINGNLIYGCKAVFYQVLLLFIFLPYQAYMMADAIIRTLYRVFISKKNLLEWVTAADTERKLKNDVSSYVKRMNVSIITAVIVLILVYFVEPRNMIYAISIGLLWGIAPIIAHKISKEEKLEVNLSKEDIKILRRLARKTWAYYEDFAGEEENYLPIDNYQEDPPNGLATRTSPTNIGFLLISILTARDLGYISTTQMLDRINKTLSTIEKLETWKGHLYNWYDTRSLEVLLPLYVSTVDSGNFIGYLITLKQGLLEYIKNPIADKKLLLGIKDTLEFIDEKYIEQTNIDDLINKEKISTNELKKLIKDLLAKTNNESNWDIKLNNMLNSLEIEIDKFIVNTEVKEKFKNIKNQIDNIQVNKSLVDLKEIYENIILDIDEIFKNQKLNKDQKEYLLNIKNNILKSKNNIEEVLSNINNLVNRLDRIVESADFRYLYDKKRHLFSIGYNVKEEKLTNSYYDLLASEARLTSYIAIARKQIPKKHWFKMGRALSVIDGYRGLVSWTATMFEYFMPPLVMKNYKNTLLDETYGTVIKAQKKYGEKRKVPWGTSESGYYGFDMNLNYQYKAFGVPDLGLKRGLVKDMVISPYSTVLALPFNDRESMDNINRLIGDKLEGEYGFYEAIDYTLERLPRGKEKMVVQSFMAHHQGMSLIAFNNYLNKNIMQERFHSDPVIKSGEVLLQEKVPVRAIITKEYKDEIEPLQVLEKEDVQIVRTYDSPSSSIPRCHILSNGRYFVMVTDDGRGYSKKEDIQVTRWREDLITGSHGSYIFIKDLGSNQVWSSTYEPLNKEPDGYKIKFSQDKAEFIRTDRNIDTHTEIVVSPEDDAEIRKVTLTNHGNESTVIELTSYFETVLTHQAADIVHPAFTNLFIRTEPILEYDSIIASRRPRMEGQDTIWMVHTISVEGELLGNLEYETNRGNFIGRGRNIKNPIAMSQALKNTSGPVLDPIMSLRRKVKIEPGNSVVVSFTTAIAKDRREAVDLAKKYYDNSSIPRAFELAYTRSQVENTYLNFKGDEVKTYQDMISHIVFLSSNRRKNENLLKQNVKGQSSLWAYGISGDIPIVLVSIRSVDDINIVKEALKAHEYWKMKGLAVDLVILNEDESSYLQPLQELLRDTVSSKYGHDMFDKPGGIFVRNANIMPEEDRILIYTVARIVLRGEYASISSQIKIENKNYDIKEKIFKEDDWVYTSKDEPLDVDYFNGYGGFTKDQKEYVIRIKENIDTPAPWVNVIANKNFGFHVSENGSGFTWAENSRENKLTSWSNDPVSDPPGEVIYFRDEVSGKIWTTTALPIREKESYTVHHGYGYSKFLHDSNGINQELTMFVPVNDLIKINMIKLKNNSSIKRTLTATYYIRPVMGVSDQFTQQYIITDMDENNNKMLIKNPYNSDFPGRISFMTSSENIEYYTGDREEFLGSKGDLARPEALRKEKLSNNVGAGFEPCCVIQILIELNPKEEKELVFLFGQEKDINKVNELVNKYKNIDNCKEALQEVKDNWDSILGTIQVKTPDLSMDLLVNNWLLYQNIGCRIWARSAFYQSGGAYGFRDQLQDSMNAVYAIPEGTRNQILLHCAHQFVEGDVQHWWHPGVGEKGIRTRFSDDLLWLPYATAEYIKNTGDYSILHEEVHFLEDKPLDEHEDERYGIPRISEEKSSVYNHCIRAIERSLKFGEHGIPLMGSGDWNDGMSTVGNKGKGESIWLGWFLHTILMDFSIICNEMKDYDSEKRYVEYAKQIANAIEENAWDGKWYRRAYFDDGTPLGSIKNPECTIDSLAQSWAVISGAGRKDRIKQAMESVDNYLVKKEEGMILLFTPPFENSDLHPGYIKGYVPGVRENGGQYTHAATWVIKAFALMGDGDKAWQLYNSINPINHTRTTIECSTYKVEPYVMAADVYAVNPHVGRGGWTWYTGTAGWMYRVGIEDILGFIKRKDKLIINPCIPKDWNEYSIKYRYKDTKYNITIKNPDRVNKNVKNINLDGKKLKDNSIPLVDDKLDHNVEVILG
ncbi:GH36-type glycosyl hydrolase domain-containing protein [Tepidibacter formicigenes]|jgi:cellobiose phosphorylase|uniref:Cellobiose phosphorylase n=1 Tax=Tepidibacter formicigenes DSM 15518 TaxID=1123349 RepID=A0A1M6RMN5_9FIRM|nr:glucoamylase family protein [Tepidibacter formicigenes]SHK33607.1 Cellobiose phosphorylase [Tepidibacter formicigenes DSM 15518]